ncbi:hypothetical protein Tco_1530401 [Tanacetum coccineum]
MASASSSQNKPKHLILAANVPFQVEDVVIKFNNEVALLKTSVEGYEPMLEFLRKCRISVALTKQPSVYYAKFLREFWYTTEADMQTKSITFTLSYLDKPLTFNLDTFSSVIGLKFNEPYVPVPQKETVKGRLETLGLFDEDDTSLSSNDLIKLSPVAELSPESIQSLIPSSKEVNTDDIADKSLSGTSVQSVTQSKAPTASKPRKKKNSSSTQPEASNVSRKKKTSSEQATHLQETEEFVDPDDAPKSLEASESVEVLDKIVEEKKVAKEHSLDIPTVEELPDESSMPTLINDALKHQLPGLLLEALKDCLPSLLKESLQTYIQAVSK